MSKKSAKNVVNLTPAEMRAARAERVEVFDAEPFGWIARSESGGEQSYHLYCNPETKRLVCTCADFIYRGDADASYECKHVSAVLKHIGRNYLKQSYVAPAQQTRRAA